MAKRLVETLEIIAFTQDAGMGGCNDLFNQQMQMCQHEDFAELSVLLAATQFVYLVHQVNHWQAKGDPFYGDHLLFERLYTAALPDVDALAERAVGLGCVSNVDLMPRVSMISQHVEMCESKNVMPSPTQLFQKSMAAEVLFLQFAKSAAESLKAKGMLSRGTDQLIGGLEDKHEGHIYLLKQRLSAA